MPTQHDESPQDREDRIVQRILALATVGIVAFIVVVLMFRDIPSKNEIMMGTVLGFIFGNMAGPVFRKAFGGPDTGTRQTVNAQNDVLKTAVVAASAGVQAAQTDQMNVSADTVTVSKPEGKKS